MISNAGLTWSGIWLLSPGAERQSAQPRHTIARKVETYDTWEVVVLDEQEGHEVVGVLLQGVLQHLAVLAGWSRA
jgi:hypothetical protein